MVWFVASELLVPSPVAFDAGVETRSWQVRAVIACDPGEPRKRRITWRCRVRDAAVQLSVLPRLDGQPAADPGPLLAEVTAALRSAAVDWQLSGDGRQVGWEVSGLPEGSPRDTALGRVLASTLERAMAGLVLEPGEAAQWVETTSPLLRLPDAGAATGVSQWVHQRVGDRVDSAGTALLVDGDTSIRVAARSRAELDAGSLASRSWNVDGEDDGVVVYHHAGWARRLAPGEDVDVGPSRQVRAPGEPEPAHLPEWPPL